MRRRISRPLQRRALACNIEQVREIIREVFGHERQGTAAHALLAPAEDAFSGGVPEPDAPLQVEHGDCQRRPCDDRLERLVRFKQHILHGSLFRDVAADAHQTHNLSDAVADRHFARGNPARLPCVRVDGSFFAVEDRRAGLHHCLIVSGKLGCHFFGDQVEVGLAQYLVWRGHIPVAE
ncbi:MAG: hypothetical protein M5R40_04705 [Anaerolineae bacterium]|nr:hypothetical protein [Anaerolineae bacterium]